MTQTVGRHMLARGEGGVINIVANMWRGSRAWRTSAPRGPVL
jgi:hypothetical protein